MKVLFFDYNGFEILLRLEENKLTYLCFQNKLTFFSYHALIDNYFINQQLHFNFELEQVFVLLSSCFQNKKGFRFIDFNFIYDEPVRIRLEFEFVSRPFKIFLVKDMMKEQIVTQLIEKEKDFSLIYNCIEIDKNAQIILKYE